MKLEELSLAMVKQAVNLYLDRAYGSGSHPNRMAELDLPDDASADQLIGLFQRDVVAGKSGHDCLRFAMRLGNRNYPFMKLLLQEHIMAGEYFFAVDTHDDMEIKPDYPDYDAWMAVLKFNRQLKQEIEADMAKANLPTAGTLRRIIEARPRCDDLASMNCKILVVDDEEDLAEAVESLLRARGYTMHKVYDGKSGVKAAKRMQPDLILLDYELPEMDGLEVIAALRADPSTCKIPVLLCTASRIGVGDIGKADGFLAKPYQEDLLYEMVQRVLSAERK